MNRKLRLLSITLYILALPLISYFFQDYIVIEIMSLLLLIGIGHHFWGYLGAVFTSSVCVGLATIDYFIYGQGSYLMYVFIAINMFANAIFGMKILLNDVILNNDDSYSETLQELSDSKEQFRILSRATQDAILIVNDRGQITYWNEAAHIIFGYTFEEIINKPWYLLINQHEYYDALLEGLNKFQEQVDTGCIEVLEIIALKKDGLEIPVEITVSTIFMRERWNAVIVVRNIADRKKDEEKIHRLAYYDSLTSLPNKVRFQEAVDELIVSQKSLSTDFAVFMLDLNQFKTVNDSLGHRIGDMLLIEVAKRLRFCFPEVENIYRFGGDEFAIVIDNYYSDTALENLALTIIKQFEKPYEVEGMNIFSSVSIGISCFPKDGTDMITLLRCADTAMYKAKTGSISNYVFFSSEMHAQEMEKLAIINDLQQALERNEFELYYQPQFSLNKQEVYGFEALIRWNHQEKGIIPPLKFIPIAEETGIIIEIGKWVLRTACLQQVAWYQQHAKAMCVAVNISMKEFQNTSFIGSVSNIIKETGIDSKYLELEITESIAMCDVKFVIQTLIQLKELGVSISIDDFGTGYSSLHVLKTLPIDQLKIDRSFIQDIQSNHQDKAIVETFITLAKKLQLSLVAEGVELDDQRKFLEELHCDIIQGYLISPPLKAQDTLRYLQ
ncbi:hypothetical protein BHU72_02090 [Desulfuribacillus stibiiarsenatis]|uniref:Diguanylate cyclase n=1 Tax=Desulfuribacillus stibiiarsenatis TaxID=1390249 RepID=A0A1E5L626_9FIRM|nr:bifunctional diguanylate cyclase/phosphodiesterase [Desulfuribacillus stibiiarsenatis]OEH85612.1 hypothetical protein BHU72_02090 [Desulfuribacillus stibiiarsenatis]